MRINIKTNITAIILVCVVFTLACIYLGQKYTPTFLADKSWITDFGYTQNEIYPLTFNRKGDRSCPEIPIKFGNSEYKIGFDTGCGVGIFFTDAIKDKIQYTYLGKSEELNRDGSHRGWCENVIIDEFSIFTDKYKNIKTSISDWTMFSSEKFNGTVGLAYFKSKIITIDYAGHKIAVRSNPIDYARLNSNDYIVLPLHKTTSKGQEDLPFFEAQLNGKPVTVYLDTGKNYSYVYNKDCKYRMADKPANLFDIPLKIGKIDLTLHDVAEIHDLAQAEKLPYPTMVELNSDQLWKCKLLVTFDLIKQKIIFRKI
ncbi:MAG TPA: hypothetical protein VF941_17320 [Clostridia bacterium]